MFICVIFSVSFGLETARNLCIGEYRVGFNVCCSLHISVRKETQISRTDMFGTNRKLVFLFGEESSPFLLTFAKNPFLSEKRLSTSKQVRKFRMKSSSEGRWCIDLAQKCDIWQLRESVMKEEGCSVIHKTKT